MLKRLFLALAFAGLLSPAFASGTIPFSLSQQFDSLGKPLSGCKLYTIQAGTTSTPQNAYQDSALTLALPNPQTCDAAGRLPQMFLADGSIKVRLTDKNGVTQVVADGILVIGPSGGGSGGSTVDATTVLATGDVKYRYGTGTLTGFVRANNRTIGSATSGATERANADCQALFEYLWGTDPNLAVSTGRGVSANADWVANKTITLPDGRGKALAGLDDMGNSVAGTYAGVSFFGGSATTLGALVGTARRTLTAAQLPANIPNTLAATFAPTSGTSTIYVGTNTGTVPNSPAVVGVPIIPTPVTLGGTITMTGAINPSGGSAFDTVSPYMLVTTYIKL